MSAEATTPITFNGPTFLGNVEALSMRQPGLADRLRQVQPPPTARIASGRDGMPVVQLAADEGNVWWLGGSSMPSVSAPAVLGAYVDRRSNVALPSVGTGYEPRLLAQRIPAYCAVFVCDPDITRIALALAVADLSAAIRSGRIVLIDGDPEQSLVEFFAAHPGYEYPGQLYPLPGLSEADVAERARAIERAGLKVDAARRRRFAEVAAEVSDRGSKPDLEMPRILVLSVDGIGGAVQHAAHLERAAKALGWQVARCVPEAPLQCHAFARLLAVRESEPDLIIFVNSTPGPLREHLPPDVPWVCWFTESAALPAIALEGLSACPHLLAASVPVREQLLVRGACKGSVTVLETGVDDTVFRPLEVPDDDQAWACEVAVLCDGQDISTEASNIGLESHERLWRQMTLLLGAAADRSTALDVDALLRTAERKTGTQLRDEELRRQFLTLVAGRLTKTVMARAAIIELRSQTTAALWGAHWETHAEVKALHRGVIPSAPKRNVIYSNARLVVLPFADAPAFHHAFEALAAGCCPLMRRPGREVLGFYPQTGDILEAVPSFAAVSELGGMVKRLGEDTARRKALVTRLQSTLLAGHTLKDRLTAIRDLVRPTQG